MEGRFAETEEYGRLMNMKPWRVRKLIRDGVIPAVRLPSRRYVIPLSALEELEARSRVEAEQRAQAHSAGG